MISSLERHIIFILDISDIILMVGTEKSSAVVLEKIIENIELFWSQVDIKPAGIYVYGGDSGQREMLALGIYNKLGIMPEISEGDIKDPAKYVIDAGYMFQLFNH